VMRFTVSLSAVLSRYIAQSPSAWPDMW
jgi:hypothetical protein